MMMIRICMLLVGLAVTSSSSVQAQSQPQSWPNRPIQMIVPFAAGGSTDVAARLVAQHLSKALGQQVVVENKTGANGNLGMEAAAKSAPDGYTILVVPEAIVGNAHVYKVNYEPLRDFVPVVQISRQPIVLAAHPTLGVKTIAELVTLAKKEPGIRFGTGSGAGSQQHMLTMWFAKIAGIELVQVSYRGGGQAINDLLAGHVKLGTLGSTPLMPHYKAGTLQLLAQTTATRSPALPDVPTFEEAGVKGLVSDQWLGVFVPNGTPAAVVSQLNAEINKALAEPAIRKNLEEQALEPIGGSADAFGKLVQDDFAKFERLVKELDIKVN
jgi:tripartite-type tricarboxylate transporter receptor subunit TctC